MWSTRLITEDMVDYRHVWAGVVIWLVGEAINLYHHVLLANQRPVNSQVRYLVPRGGLFGLVACPHYLGEVISFIGIAVASQHLSGWISAAFVLVNLSGRARSTRQWY